MSSPDQTNPDSVGTVRDLSNLLQQIRVLHTDSMSYAKMADSIDKKISRSEMGRILAGDDFPSRAQLHLILDILKIDRAGREAWDAMWSRLAQERFSRERSQGKQLDLPTSILEFGAHREAEDNHDRDKPISGSAEEEEKRQAGVIIEKAQEEAEQIVRRARAAAEDEYDALVRNIRSAASEIIDKVIAEQTRVIRASEEKIAGIVGDVEKKLRNVIDDLNDSVDNTQRTSEEFRQLFDHVRASVIEIRSELAQVKEEADTIRDKYNTENEAAQSARDKDRGKQKRPRLMGDWFSDTRKVPPAVIDEKPDSGVEYDDNEPPWLRDGKYYH